MRYLAHREVGDLIVAACRRARVPLASAGVVSPRPKIGFGPSLPVGVEGLHEFADLSLTRKIGGIKSLLNEHLPDGLRVNESRYMPSSTAKATKARLERAVYEARIVLESGADDGSWFDGLTRRVDALKSASTWDLEPATGSTDSGDDVKNQVSDMELSVHADGSLILGFALDLTGNGARLRQLSVFLSGWQPTRFSELGTPGHAVGRKLFA